MTTKRTASDKPWDQDPAHLIQVVTAQMARLEKAGLKDSEEFQELSRQYTLHAKALTREIVEGGFLDDPL